ncbi:MAG TPA: thiamine pyrophosphate-binding protein [Burkholderiaceae bacterium]|nr:thiamine pyrophosphate-binding protein [Burkholderiaceae bacterium]
MPSSRPDSLPAARTGARLLVDQLLIQGVRRLYCVPGESYLAVLDALADCADRLQVVVNRHESGSAFMAEAEAKLTGQPGVAFVTRGPGATNAAIGVHTAAQDSTPLVLFIGQVGSDARDREAFQEIDYRAMFGGIAKWVVRIDRADRIPELVARAFQTATSGRPGPVVVELPEDMLAASTRVADALRHRPVGTAPGAQQLELLRSLLADAHRPLVLAGGSGWTTQACADLRRFAEAHALPVTCAFRRQDLYDNRLPNYAGDVGIAINPRLAARVREADLLLALGARLDEMTSSGYTLIEAPVPMQTLVHAHADAAELGRVFQPALAIQATPPELAAALAALAPPTAPRWAAATRQARTEYEQWQARPAVYADATPALDLWEVVQILRRALPADAIVANGAGNFATWGHRFWRYAGLRTQLAPVSGAMGYGVPAAIAAKIAAPERSVVCLAGDGDFLMTGQELATAVAQRAGVLLLVFNNGLYGTIRMHQEREFPGRPYATALANPDFAALARAHGAFGTRAASTEEFGRALPAALAHLQAQRTPALIELACDPEVITPNATLASLRSAAVPRGN